MLFHLQMPPSGGIAESRYDNLDLWDNLIGVFPLLSESDDCLRVQINKEFLDDLLQWKFL